MYPSPWLRLPASPVRALLPALLAAALLAAQAGLAAEQAPAPIRGLVILAQFPDVPHQVERSFVDQRFNTFLAKYVREMSSGHAGLSADLTPGWATLPRPVADYHISPRNLEVDKRRVMLLIDDALELAPPGADLDRYDFVAIMLGATASEYGMVGLCGYPGMLGWSSRGEFRSRRGNILRHGVAIFTSQAHPGTIFHDVAHVLGGVRDGKRAVPCLYDHDLQARPGPPREVFIESIVNMGYWDPMSCHFHKREIPPPGISSWTRLRLGWLDPGRVRTLRPGERAEVPLGPLADDQAATVAVRIPLSPSSYYLVENRQPLGYDANLPGSGVLVMFADDTVDECRHGRSPVKLANANPDAPRLTGAAFGPPGPSRFVDAARGVALEVLSGENGTLRVRFGPP